MAKKIKKTTFENQLFYFKLFNAGLRIELTKIKLF